MMQRIVSDRSNATRRQSCFSMLDQRRRASPTAGPLAANERLSHAAGAGMSNANPAAFSFCEADAPEPAVTVGASVGACVLREIRSEKVRKQ